MKEFKKIKEIAKITKCRVKIERKKGLPFILHRYKKRKLFFAAFNCSDIIYIWYVKFCLEYRSNR